MSARDRIRLTGSLSEGPAKAGPSYVDGPKTADIEHFSAHRRLAPLAGWRLVAQRRESLRLGRLIGDPGWLRSPISRGVGGRSGGRRARPGTKPLRRRQEAVGKCAGPVPVPCVFPAPPPVRSSLVPYTTPSDERTGKGRAGIGRRCAGGAPKRHLVRLPCPSTRFHACSSTPDPSLGELSRSWAAQLTKRPECC